MIQKGCHKIRAHSGSPGAPKLADSENIFSKSVFKRGVKSTRNDLICLDSKSCDKIFFFKKLRRFLRRRLETLTKKFFQKRFFKRGVNSTKNDLIFLDPKSCSKIFFKKLKILGLRPQKID